MPPPRFKFVNYGGTYMLRIESAEDLQALPLLDEPFWIATSAPIHHLRCDPRFLAFLDADGDGRILSQDVRRAHAWMTARLGNLEGVTNASDVLMLDSVNDAEPAVALKTAARRILFNLGKEAETSITLAEVRDHQAYRTKGFHNGDGIIPAAAIEDDEELRAFVEDLVATMGGSTDMNGTQGVAEADLEAFLKAARTLLEWRQRAEAENDDSAGLFPLGEQTAPAYDLLAGLREAVERYFRLCRLTRLNDMLERATPIPNSPVDIQAAAEEVDGAMAQAPLAKPVATETLALDQAINPHFRARLEQLRAQVLTPLLGDAWSGLELTVDQWTTVNQAFSLYEAWLNAKTGGEVEKLGPEKLRAYLDGPLPERLRELIKADQAIGQELSVVQDLENLILMQRWFLELVNNFISFHNLYDPEIRALFEMGRMVIGGRVFNLNMQVKDVNAHANLAKNSGILLLYSEVTSAKKEETFFVVTPVTSMTLGRLGPERRGVLFDLTGREWDARVIKIVENPISLWEAICKPFQRVGAAIASSFNKIVGSAEKQLETGITQNLSQVETTVKSGMAPPPAPAAAPAAPAAAPAAAGVTPARSNAQGWLFTGSMAFAAIGSSFAFIASKLKDGIPWQSIVIILAVGLAIVLIPTILIAWFRLRRRNLGSLLEASGWAINAEMRVSRRLAKVLAPKLRHPANFRFVRTDLTRCFLERIRHKVSAPETPAESSGS